MNLQEELLREHSRKQTDKIIAYVGEEEHRFQELIELFLQGEYVVTQRAAWPIGIICSSRPYLFYPYLDRAIQLLKQSHIHDAVVRNLLRILMEIKIPNQFQSEMVDICLAYIETPNKPSAIKAFSIGILENICLEHPDLAKEVQLILDQRLSIEKPAFVSRANRFKRQMQKVKRANP
ncbi:MAG: hypothetical protein K2Q22_10055 [Cytophagales bacterium]|nr:hypothetical protein [Cytophagales bacterium]